MEDSRQSIDDSRNLLDSDSDDVEENVFDYQSQNDKQIGKQLALLFTWGTMGLIYAIPGPNLLDIACKMDTSLGRLGPLFIARSVGSLGGKSLSNSFIYHNKRYGMMTLILVVLMVLQGVFPLISNFQGGIFIMLALGGAYGLLYEGYRILDISNGLYRGGDLNKRSFALSIGAALAPVISSPFVTAVVKSGPAGNGTVQKHTLMADKQHQSSMISIFPGTLCLHGSNFGKSFWLTIVPCAVLLIILCYFLFQSSTSSIRHDTEQGVVRNSQDWTVYASNLLLFTVVFFYRGIYRIAESVFFVFIILGPFDINKTKASLFLMILWIAFAFGHILQQIINLKVVRAERKLGIVFFKSCICLIVSILLLKIDNTDALTISLLVYMFVVSELGPMGQDILLKQGVTTERLMWKLAMFADTLAEMIFPASALALMYTKGWRVLTFVILAISVLQFLACSALALCPLAAGRNVLAMDYENLSMNKQEDGNRRRMRKEISKLLGGYTDHEVSYATSDDEVVFDKRRQRLK